MIFCLSGPVVCLSGKEDLLAIVYYSSKEKGATLLLKLINMSYMSEKKEIPLSLSPKSDLKWASFSEENKNFTYMDSKGVFRSYYTANSMTVPILELEDSVNFWPISVDNSQVFGVHLKENQLYPKVESSEKESISLSIPFPSSNLSQIFAKQLLISQMESEEKPIQQPTNEYYKLLIKEFFSILKDRHNNNKYPQALYFFLNFKKKEIMKNILDKCENEGGHPPKFLFTLRSCLESIFPESSETEIHKEPIKLKNTSPTKEIENNKNEALEKETNEREKENQEGNKKKRENPFAVKSNQTKKTEQKKKRKISIPKN